MSTSRSAAVRRPRIVDVARLAGVSPQTVSNVINDRGGFTEPTRNRVEDAIAELGFQPNRYAQSLRSLRTGLIGFDMVNRQLDVSNPFTLGLLHALVPAAAHHDRRILVFTHEEQQESDFRTSASSGLVDGFILSDSTVGDPRARILQEMGIPFVVMGRPGTPEPVAWVDIDNVAAMAQPVDHLVEQGCRDIAFVAYSGRQHWNTDRRRGTREALARHGIALPRHRILASASLPSIRHRLPGFLLDRGVPDAVVTSSDSIAVSVIGIAASVGIQVGSQMAVTGFDDSALTSMVTPEITSVSLPVGPIADQLLTMFETVLEGGSVDQSAQIETRLVVRGSSGFTADRDA